MQRGGEGQERHRVGGRETKPGVGEEVEGGFMSF